MTRIRWLVCALVAAMAGVLHGQGIDPGIIGNPQPFASISGGGEVELGQAVTLTAQFSGAGADPTYQWRKNGIDLPGGTTRTWTIPAATPSDSGTYGVVLRTPAGESVATTQLTVKAAAAPVITANPRPVVAEVGQSAEFSVSASGSHPRTYQWHKDGSPVAGGTNAILSLAGLTPGNAGAYSVVVANSLGSATSTAAALTVNAATPPVIARDHPFDVTATEGSTVTLLVSMTSGSAPFRYQWLKNGAELAERTSAQLHFPAVSGEDGGRYSVRVSNAAGAATSREATLTVNRAVPPSISSHPQSQTLGVGQRGEFSVIARGSEPLRYQWLKNGAAIAGATASRYSVFSAAIADAGDYSVTVTNDVGSVTSNIATLAVTLSPPPTITVQPADVTVDEGRYAALSVSASGTSRLNYQWYQNGQPIYLANGPELVFAATQVKDAGSYHVVVRNGSVSVTSRTATLGVIPAAPPAVVPLGNLPLPIGTPLEYRISQIRYSVTPATYQWYRNGTPIPGATLNSFGINQVSDADAGDYFVVMSNGTGSTPSQTSHVTIWQPQTPAAGGWVASQRVGDLVYFAFANPPRVERFNLASNAWLPVINLPRVPAAFVAAPDAFYTSTGANVYRYTPDGAGETVLGSAFDSAVTGLAIAREFLLVLHGAFGAASATVLRTGDGARISSGSYGPYWGPQLAVADSLGRLYSRSSGLSLSRITTTTLSPTGVLGTSATFGPIGATSSASRVFVAPDESYVGDYGSMVYGATDLRFLAGLGVPFDDLAYTASGQPVILRGTSVTLLDRGFNEAGRGRLAAPAAAIQVRGGEVIGFGATPPGGAITVSRLALSALAAPEPAAPIDAAAISFTPDFAFIDRDGIAVLFSKVHRQLFRWSPAERRFLASIPLQGWPNFVTYSAITHRIYLGYADNRILQVRLDAGSTREQPFAVAPQRIHGLATAGEFVFLVDEFGGSLSYLTFSPDGRLVAQRGSAKAVQEYTWDPVLRRMYQFDLDISAYALGYTEITAAGEFGRKEGSSLRDQLPNRYPIRVAPDGQAVVIGSGEVFDTVILSSNRSLANRIHDAAWVTGRLFTGRQTAAGHELQRWGGNNLTLDRSSTLSGRLYRLFSLSGGRLLAISTRNGGTTFTVLNGDLDVLSVDAGGPGIANLAARALAGRDDQLLIPGFVVSGAMPKRMLIRAAGPALTSFGVSDVLANPMIAVMNQSGAEIAANDDWGSASNLAELIAVTNRVGAFAFPTGSRDAAALLSLAPGAYTVQTRSRDDTTGVALVEIYDAQDESNSSRIVNLATRALVGSGADVLIPGIVIRGTAAKNLLIRAVGPTLSTFGVSGVLANPRLRLYRGDQLLRENEGWDRDGANTATQLADAANRAGAFVLPAGSKDAALLLNLTPGSYTAHVSGADGGSGVALVEIYDVP